MSQEDFKVLKPNEEIKLSGLSSPTVVEEEPKEPAGTGELILKLIIEKEDHVSR